MEVKIQTFKGDILCVLLPERTTRYSISDYENHLSIYLECGMSSNHIKLDKGFQLISTLREITEDESRMMIAKLNGGPWHSYKDYTCDNNWFASALWSFRSLMRANGIYEVNPFNPGKFPNSTNKLITSENDYVDARYDQFQYDEAQQRTGNWIILFKPHRQDQ